MRVSSFMCKSGKELGEENRAFDDSGILAKLFAVGYRGCKKNKKEYLWWVLEGGLLERPGGERR